MHTTGINRGLLGRDHLNIHHPISLTEGGSDFPDIKSLATAALPYLEGIHLPDDVGVILHIPTGEIDPVAARGPGINLIPPFQQDGQNETFLRNSLVNTFQPHRQA